MMERPAGRASSPPERDSFPRGRKSMMRSAEDAALRPVAYRLAGRQAAIES